MGHVDLYFDHDGRFTNSLKREFTQTKNIGLSKTQSSQIIPMFKTILKIEQFASSCKKYFM